MSHGDHVSKLPKGFKSCGVTSNSPIAALYHPTKKIFGLQFHPEVTHTPQGKQISILLGAMLWQCDVVSKPQVHVQSITPVIVLNQPKITQVGITTQGHACKRGKVLCRS